MARPKVIAVDFDGTIVTHEYPEIGVPIVATIDYLKAQKIMGNKLILWTCRTGKELKEAVDYCKSIGVFFDAVNEDVQSVKDTEFGKNKSCKVCADFYLDDRSLKLEDLY